MGADTKGATPPALTAAQMALVQTLADVLHNKTGEACQALLSDWFELRAENTELRARIEALERERDAASSHNRELLLHLAEAQANLNDVASKLAVEDARSTRQAKTIRGLEGVIRELVTLVRGECPSLLDEDRGGDGRLSLAIDALLTPPPATTGEEPLAKRWAHPNGPYEGCGCDYDGWGTRLRACAEHRAKEPTR